MATKPTGVPGLRIAADNVAELRLMMKILADREVLVGFPKDTTKRDPEEGAALESLDITNAALGYIHDKGMPEQNIPARPFMLPGIEDAKPAVTKHLKWTAKQVLRRAGVGAVLVGFERAGIAAQFALRRKINEGIPPPLAPSTLAERARKGRKGAKQEIANRAAGMEASTQLAKPLIDTGQLRNAINYVIRERKVRKK